MYHYGYAYTPFYNDANTPVLYARQRVRCGGLGLLIFMFAKELHACFVEYINRSHTTPLLLRCNALSLVFITQTV